ncbi:HvfB family MNIO-type RiPP peptide maturase [Methylobacter sp. sgz302048]|uniref:HvfB family MNIO-type RiPP peptide maturase n=1 Tax=Methylobacter sp. sgz302048 TaxID=3455945 RepID=UPI003F9FDF81
MDTTLNLVHGAGMGLRRSFLTEIVENPPKAVDFYEVAPENWITIGGKLGKQFRAMTERFDFVCHGLSLSIGSTDPLDEKFVREVKNFMAEHQIKFYSEHLSYCSNEGHLYDLMPMPFTSEAVSHVASRIRRVQDILEQRIAIENISYYAAPGQEMSEIDFFNAVVAEADCDVLIDINNIYVNSVNHGYDAESFLKAIPADRIAYAHIAGHYVEAEDFLVDTHGADIIDPVWKLLGKAYELYGVFPTLLERDFNIPPLKELVKEVRTIRLIQNAWKSQHEKQSA